MQYFHGKNVPGSDQSFNSVSRCVTICVNGVRRLCLPSPMNHQVRGIIPHLEGFDFEARCKIASYEVARVPKNGDAQVHKNSGGTYENRIKRMVQQAKRGDVFYFSSIKCKCRGDQAARNLNGLVFNIR